MLESISGDFTTLRNNIPTAIFSDDVHMVIYLADGEWFHCPKPAAIPRRVLELHKLKN